MTDAAAVVRTEGQQVTGSIKVWYLEKGYGFMKCGDGGSDLFVHQSALTVTGEVYRAVLPGTAVLAIFYTRDGKDTAKDVTAADGTPLPGFATRLDAAQQIGSGAAALANTKAVPAGHLGGKVKFMNKDKGFGFITPDMGGEDMFVHVGDVEGQRILEQNEPVSYTTAVKKGDRAQAVQVVPLRAAPVAAPPAFGYSPYGPPPMGQFGYAPQGPAYGAPTQGYGAPQAAYQPPPPPSGTIGQGTIKWFNETKDFGFIVPGGGGTEVYFKGVEVHGGGPPLAPDEAVNYEIQSSPSGKVWACNISRVRSKRKAAEPVYDQGAYKRPAYPQPDAYGAPQQHGQGAPQGYAPYGAPAQPQGQYGAPPQGQYTQPAYAAAAPAPGNQQYQQPGPPAAQYQQTPQQYGQAPQQYGQQQQQYY